MPNDLSVATMLINDSYFMGNLYHLLIYSSKCEYIMKRLYYKWIWHIRLSKSGDVGGRLVNYNTIFWHAIAIS